MTGLTITGLHFQRSYWYRIAHIQDFGDKKFMASSSENWELYRYRVKNLFPSTLYSGLINKSFHFRTTYKFKGFERYMNKQKVTRLGF